MLIGAGGSLVALSLQVKGASCLPWGRLRLGQANFGFRVRLAINEVVDSGSSHKKELVSLKVRCVASRELKTLFSVTAVFFHPHDEKGSAFLVGGGLAQGIALLEQFP